jgi:hypothetical protein
MSYPSTPCGQVTPLDSPRRFHVYLSQTTGSEEEDISSDLQSNLPKSKKILINGDGRAAPPAESEYEKIEIFSNTVPIDAYLKLKQMLVESDNRIQELLAANQDLKQEVSLLQNMVQTLMQENVNLRRSAGDGPRAPAPFQVNSTRRRMMQDINVK